jgi:enterochelin esterase-like enzyme
MNCAVTVIGATLAFAAFTPGQNQPAAKGTVERVKVHGKSLEGNLEGDSPDRSVSVYLPPSYKTSANRRYPVLYFLHGFTDSDAKWFGFEKHWISFPAVMDEALSQRGTREMIVVTPDAYTRFKGSMYSNSVTTGDWEDYVSRELVAYVDSHYRTIPAVSSRGLAGHSMGGYGAIRIGMKHPEVFSSIYLLSPCCMGPLPNIPKNTAEMQRIESVRTFDDVAKAGFMPSAILASAAAWSPDPRNPPLYLALPWRDGQPDPAIVAKFAANAPLAMIDQYVPGLRALHAIAFDAGDKDTSIAAAIKILDGVLNRYGIAHTYEQYEGDHVNRIAERLRTRALPFFSQNLEERWAASFVGPPHGRGAN